LRNFIFTQYDSIGFYDRYHPYIKKKIQQHLKKFHSNH